MGNATRWYCSREAVKAAVGIAGARQNKVIDRNIEAASEAVELMLRSRGVTSFIPITQTRLYPWPQYAGRNTILDLDGDLLAVTALLSEAQDTSPTTIAAADYFLEPVNQPPYRRIEIDRSSTSGFAAGDTSQRSISVAGRWAYSENTKTAGTVTSGLAADAAATSFVCSNSSLIDVGDTLLIETEQVFVSERSTVDVGKNLAAGLNQDIGGVTVTMEAAHGILAGEVILVDSEKMYVEDVTGVTLTVIRQWDGTQLAAHSNGADVYVYRTLTIVRGVNGTTAATHANSTAISKYAPPAPIVQYCIAETVLRMKQGESGWTGQMGGPEGTVQVRPYDITTLRERIVEEFGMVTL